MAWAMRATKLKAGVSLVLLDGQALSAVESAVSPWASALALRACLVRLPAAETASLRSPGASGNPPGGSISLRVEASGNVLVTARLRVWLPAEMLTVATSFLSGK